MPTCRWCRCPACRPWPRALREHGEGRVLAAFDARMGEVHWGRFGSTPAGIMRAAGGEVCMRPSSGWPCRRGDDWVGSGSGWRRMPISWWRDVRRAVCHGTAMVHAVRCRAALPPCCSEGAGVAAVAGAAGLSAQPGRLGQVMSQKPSPSIGTTTRPGARSRRSIGRRSLPACAPISISTDRRAAGDLCARPTISCRSPRPA